MKLYMHPASTTSRPIMLFAALSEIPLEMSVVDLTQGEHYGPEFSRLNPNHMVPVLQVGDWVLTESSAILKYLADSVDSPLYPRDLKQRARVNERMDWFNTNFYRDWGYNLIYPQVLEHHARANAEHTRATVDWGRAKSALALAILDRHILGSHLYACGDSLTIADLFGAQIISIGELVRADLTRHPNLHRWFERMKALPAWKKVNEAHEAFVAALADRALVGL